MASDHDHEPKSTCPSCGYRVDRGRCPECGETVPLYTRPPERMSRATRNRLVIQFILGLATGVAAWKMSSAGGEPWDNEPGRYLITSALAGMISAAIHPRYFWAAAVWCYLGQTIAMWLDLTPGDPVILPPYCSSALFGLPPILVGAALSYAVRNFIARPTDD